MAEIQEVDVRTALKEMNDGAFLLDVREANEFEAGHADGAVSIPLSELSVRVEEVPLDREVYIICKSGGRSGQATEALAEMGYHVTNVKGGSLDWRGEGLPFVAEDEEATPTVI